MQGNVRSQLRSWHLCYAYFLRQPSDYIHRSKRSRIFEAGKNASPSWELLPDDYLKETITPTSTMVGAINTITLSQFGKRFWTNNEVGKETSGVARVENVLIRIVSGVIAELQETGPSQEPLHPYKLSIDKISNSMLQYAFSNLPVEVYALLIVLSMNFHRSAHFPDSFLYFLCL